MASPINITVVGFEELEKGFMRAPKEFIRVFDPTIKKIVFMLVGVTRPRTPIDTGFLRGPGMTTTFQTLVGHIGNSAPYAEYVHDGTSKMAARPFFDWGAEAGESQAQRMFSDAITQFIKII